ncbi:hypothetical protein ACFQU7_06080 [Pseudoroseomonas wenyumeiae]
MRFVEGLPLGTAEYGAYNRGHARGVIRAKDEDERPMNFADARKWMVDGQVRPNKVTDTRIIEAMLELPRHLFVPQHCIARAHADEDVPSATAGC